MFGLAALDIARICVMPARRLQAIIGARFVVLIDLALQVRRLRADRPLPLGAAAA